MLVLKVGPETGRLAPFRFKLKTIATEPCDALINCFFPNPKRQCGIKLPVFCTQHPSLNSLLI